MCKKPGRKERFDSPKERSHVAKAYGSLSVQQQYDQFTRAERRDIVDYTQGMTCAEAAVKQNVSRQSIARNRTMAIPRLLRIKVDFRTADKINNNTDLTELVWHYRQLNTKGYQPTQDELTYLKFLRDELDIIIRRK